MITMTQDEETAGKSLVISERRSEGITGPSREVSKRDEKMPGAGCAGQENEELRWARRHMPDEPVVQPAQQPDRENPVKQPVQEVFRKTELHNAPPPPEQDELAKFRQRMMQRLKRRDCEVSYQPYEIAFRDFISSLMVRQDRSDAELREQVAALWEQIGTLEERLERKTDRLDRRLYQLEERGRS